MNIGTTLPFTQLKAGHRDDKRKKNQRCSAFDFQRDADISTFQMMDQTWPSLALTFHLKRWPRVRNDAGLLNIQMHPGLTSPCFYSDLIWILKTVLQKQQILVRRWLMEKCPALIVTGQQSKRGWRVFFIYHQKAWWIHWVIKYNEVLTQGLWWFLIKREYIVVKLKT